MKKFTSPKSDHPEFIRSDGFPPREGGGGKGEERGGKKKEREIIIEREHRLGNDHNSPTTLLSDRGD